MSFLNKLAFWRPSKEAKKLIQSNIYEKSESITFLLKQLQKHLLVITVRLKGDNDTYNTAIVKVDYKNKLFYLDELVPTMGNTILQNNGLISIRTRLDGAIINAEAHFKELINEDGFNYHVMHFPKQIYTTQRRESYRVNIPLSQHIQVNMQTGSGKLISGHLNDISFSGIAIRLEPNKDFDLKVGDNIPFVTLYLDSTILCEMEIKRHSNTLGKTLISGHLNEASAAHQKIIQRFIIQLDREKRKQSSL